jgi:hypothetical protein
LLVLFAPGKGEMSGSFPLAPPLPAVSTAAMRYRLRTLLILMAVLPPLLAGAWPCVKPILWPPVPAQRISMDVFTPIPSGQPRNVRVLDDGTIQRDPILEE